MLKIALSSLALLSALTSMASAEPAKSMASSPMVLTESQMDSVTAGTVIVSVQATAIALGEPAITQTLTDTKVWGSRNGRIEIGTGYGQAYACCGPNTYANVTTSAYADGRTVIILNNSTRIRTPNDTFASARVVVISINRPSGSIDRTFNTIGRYSGAM
jgi:hypothetical protein